MIINMTSGGVVPQRILDARTITPGTKDQIIEEGTYLRGPLTILGDPDLLEENIKEGREIFGKLGTPGGSGNIVWGKYSNKPGVTVAAVFSFHSGSRASGSPMYGQFKVSTNNASYGADVFATSDFAGKTIVQQVGTTTYNHKLNANGTVTTTTGGSTYSRTWTWNPSTGILRIDGHGFEAYDSCTYPSVSKAVEVASYGFVVDNDYSAYPSDGFHTDGLYYQLLASVSSANVMSLSDGALDTVQQDYRDQIETEVSNA